MASDEFSLSPRASSRTVLSSLSPSDRSTPPQESRDLAESRKLLAHLIQCLESQVSKTTLEAESETSGRGGRHSGGDKEVAREEEATDLAEQLRDLLVLADTKGLLYDSLPPSSSSLPPVSRSTTSTHSSTANPSLPRFFSLLSSLAASSAIRPTPSVQSSRPSTALQATLLHVCLIILRASTDIEDPTTSSLASRFVVSLLEDCRRLNEFQTLPSQVQDLAFDLVWTLYRIGSPDKKPLLIQLLSYPRPDVAGALSRLLPSDDAASLACEKLETLFALVTDLSLADRPLSWITNAVQLHRKLLSCLWDGRAEVRAKSKVLVLSLLRKHFQFMTVCFEAYLESDEPQMLFTSFLVRLQPYFPDWQLLGWQPLLDCLFEADFKLISLDRSTKGRLTSDLYVQNDEPDPAISDERSSFEGTRLQLLLLALQSIGSERPVDLTTLLHLKYHLVRALRFSDVEVLPTTFVQFAHAPSSLSDSLLASALKGVLDSPVHLEIDGSRCLVGAVMGDVVAAVVGAPEMLFYLPDLDQRVWIELMLIIAWKHETKSPALQRFEPVLLKSFESLASLTVRPISIPNKVLILTVCCVFVDHWEKSAVAKTLPRVVIAISQLLLSFDEDASPLARQARSFLAHSFETFGPSGLYLPLFHIASDPASDSSSLNAVITAIQQSVLDPEARSEPIRYVLQYLAEKRLPPFQSIGNIFRSLSRYLERVRLKGIDAGMATNFEAVCGKLEDKSHDRTTYDPAPFFSFSITFGKQARSRKDKFKSQLINLFRSQLRRRPVPVSIIVALESVYGLAICTIALDTLIELLSAKNDSWRATLVVLVEYALLSSTAQDVQQQKTRLLPRLASEALRLLSSPPGAQRTFNAVEFDELASYSRLVLAADARDEGFMQGWVNSQLNGDLERAAPTNLRLLSWLTLSDLVQRPHLHTAAPSSGFPSTLVLLSPLAAYTISSTLAICFSSQDQHRAPEHLSAAFAFVKLYILFLSSRTTADGDEPVEARVTSFLEEIFPPWQSLIERSLTGSPIQATIAQSMLADLLAFLYRQPLAPRFLLSVSLHLEELLLEVLSSEGNRSVRAKAEKVLDLVRGKGGRAGNREGAFEAELAACTEDLRAAERVRVAL